MEKPEIYQFDNTFTSRRLIADIYFYLKQLEAEAGFSDDTSKEEMLESFGALRGLTARIKAGVEDVVEEYLETSLDSFSEDSNVGVIKKTIDEIFNLAFYEEQSVEEEREIISERLQQIDILGSRIERYLSRVDEEIDKATDKVSIN